MLLDGKHVLFIAYKQFQFLELAAWPYNSLNQPNSHFTRSLAALPTTFATPQDRKAYQYSMIAPYLTKLQRLDCIIWNQLL